MQDDSSTIGWDEVKQRQLEVLRRLEEIAPEYRSLRAERRDLATLANLLGVSTRRISSIIGESPSTVSNWVRDRERSERKSSL